jgi:ABC-2 type transport system ATP-binding protein
VLDASMESVSDRFVDLLVNADRAEEARRFKPIDEQTLPFGKTRMIFDGVPQAQLAGLGETGIPGLADLFVATMKGTYA